MGVGLRLEGVGFQLVFDTAVSAVILQAGCQLDESDNVLISSVCGLLAKCAFGWICRCRCCLLCSSASSVSSDGGLAKPSTAMMSFLASHEEYAPRVSIEVLVRHAETHPEAFGWASSAT